MNRGENEIVEYSGDVSGAYSGDFELTINFEEGKVEGIFRGGNYSLDITGSISNREIKARGSVMGRTVKISGKISEDKSSIKGEWKVSGFASGEWRGTKSQNGQLRDTTSES